MTLEKLVFGVKDIRGEKVEVEVSTTLYKGTTEHNSPYFVEITAKDHDTAYGEILRYDLDAGKFLESSFSLTPFVPIENQQEFMKDLNEIYSSLLFSGEISIKLPY